MTRLFLVILVLPNLLAASFVSAQEIGLSTEDKADVVFRTFDATVTNDHAALYKEFIEASTTTPANPDDLSKHTLMEIQGIGEIDGIIVQSTVGFSAVTLLDFSTASIYWGAYTRKQTAPLFGARKAIIETAQELFNREPPIEPIVSVGDLALNLWLRYVKTDLYLSDPVEVSEIEEMRSDAFIEYAYAKNGLSILLTGNASHLCRQSIVSPIGLRWLQFCSGKAFLTPRTQRTLMQRAISDWPDITVWDTSSGQYIRNATNSTSVRVNVEDARSGPGRFELYRDGDLISVVNTQQPTTSYSYTSSDISELGNLQDAQYRVRAFDQAGNVGNEIFKVVTQAGSLTLRDSEGDVITQGNFTDAKCVFPSCNSPSAGVDCLWGTGISTATFSSGPSSATAGPYCNLSQGVKHLYCRDQAGNLASTEITASSVTWSLTLTAGTTTNWSASNSANTTANDILTKLLRFRVYVPTSGDMLSCATELPKFCSTIHTVWGGQEEASCECTTYGGGMYGESCPTSVCVFHVLDATAPAIPANFTITNMHSSNSVGGVMIRAAFVGGAGTSLAGSTTILRGQQITGTVTFPQVSQQTYEVENSTLTVESPLNWMVVSSTLPTSAQLAAIQQQGLRLLSPDLQSITAEGAAVAFTSTMSITIQFASSFSTPTATIRQFDGVNWESGTITSQNIAKNNGIITATGQSAHASVYGVFIDGIDTSSPTTILTTMGSSYTWGGTLFISTDSYVVLTATDALQDGYASGVSTIYYRSSASDDFSVYADSVPLPVGTYFFQYRTSDWAGNLESIKTSTFVVTNRTVTQLSGGLRVSGDMLVGYSTSGARFEVEAGGYSNYVLRVSSPNNTTMAAVDFIGNMGLGMESGDGRLSISSNAAQGDIALQLRSGNSVSSGTSSQIALGYNGESSMRDVIRTAHHSSTVGNHMDFLIWDPAVGSTATLASRDILSLQASAVANRALIHVLPPTTTSQDVELVVSNGVTEGGGIIRCKETVGTSAKGSKDSIRYLTAKDEDRALADIASMQPVRFRYKKQGPKGELLPDPSQLLRRGYIYEDAPASIKVAGGALSIDERIANAEMALKASMRNLEKLQKRFTELQARKKK